jgi:hypothetical protein
MLLAGLGTGSAARELLVAQGDHGIDGGGATGGRPGGN